VHDRVLHRLDRDCRGRHDVSQVKKRHSDAFMKVLHVGKFYPPHMGGMEIYLQQLVSYQSSLMDVEALVANDLARTQVERIDGGLITRVASFGTIASMPLTPALGWHLHKQSADIIHLHTPNPGGALALLPSLGSSKLVITHHSDTLGRPLLRKIVSPFVQNAMNRASRIIVTSSRYRDTSDELAPYRDKCTVIPLGIDPMRFEESNAVAAEQLRSLYGTRIILAVGRLVPYKGFEYLIRGMRNVNAVLLLVGNGPLRNELDALIHECELQNKVHLIDKVDDALIPAFYKAASIFVMPSITHAEAFGIVQLEAMASSKPVINTNIPSGVPEVSVHGQTGLTVPPKDSDALSKAMNLLLENDDLRIGLGRMARLRVHKEFTAEQMALRTVTLYKDILSHAQS
jgi:glycosyltransferase involved in cell wall biosynthesis